GIDCGAKDESRSHSSKMEEEDTSNLLQITWLKTCHFCPFWHFSFVFLQPFCTRFPPPCRKKITPHAQ
ncbi:MAG: hypothetical protein SPL12_00890, partial [Bacteroidales bacterium]|nr:hypothetical protein [Bacteroidales bacterium]